MPPRLYNADRVVPIPRKSPPKTSQEIPRDAKLYSISNASKLLNEQFDGGFSPKSIRALIQNGEWQLGTHYVLVGKRVRIYLEAVKELQLRQ